MPEKQKEKRNYPIVLRHEERVLIARALTPVAFSFTKPDPFTPEEQEQARRILERLGLDHHVEPGGYLAFTDNWGR